MVKQPISAESISAPLGQTIYPELRYIPIPLSAALPLANRPSDSGYR
ncbi:hypothetical protein [Thermocoleostomius sinensis]|uniref:Uncharacterized protein n=1 Tax=Thermocoleostomius sinensis A174 TaxID=2016057 RepID=A0A9E8ZPJ2_9CYAN|nr:hypothetical protein [Thermocoleostomius sinensis]WAL62546.1 hypothetical protein OXH18_11300 [Thermocoleostomius sinensis A174]